MFNEITIHLTKMNVHELGQMAPVWSELSVFEQSPIPNFKILDNISKVHVCL